MKRFSPPQEYPTSTPRPAQSSRHRHQLLERSTPSKRRTKRMELKGRYLSCRVLGEPQYRRRRFAGRWNASIQTQRCSAAGWVGHTRRGLVYDNSRATFDACQTIFLLRAMFKLLSKWLCSLELRVGPTREGWRRRRRGT